MYSRDDVEAAAQIIKLHLDCLTCQYEFVSLLDHVNAVKEASRTTDARGGILNRLAEIHAVHTMSPQHGLDGVRKRRQRFSPKSMGRSRPRR